MFTSCFYTERWVKSATDWNSHTSHKLVRKQNNNIIGSGDNDDYDDSGSGKNSTSTYTVSVICMYVCVCIIRDITSSTPSYTDIRSSYDVWIRAQVQFGYLRCSVNRSSSCWTCETTNTFANTLIKRSWWPKINRELKEPR